MKKLNNKGYLLVEIIVAFSIATAFMYIISDITIRVKNRNDDLKAKMYATVDQTIIYNAIMGEAYHYDKDGKNKNYADTVVTCSGKTFSYNGNVLFTSDYVSLSCNSTEVRLSVQNYGTFVVTPHSVNIKKYLNK